MTGYFNFRDMTVLTNKQTNKQTNKHTNKLANKHTNKQTQTYDPTDASCTVSKSCVTVHTQTCSEISELLDNVMARTEKSRLNSDEITEEAHLPEIPVKNKESVKNNNTGAMSEENFVTNLFSFLDDTVESTQTDSKTGKEIKCDDLYPFKQRNVSPSDGFSPASSPSPPTYSPSSSFTLHSSPKLRDLPACTRSHVMTETQIYEELYPEYDVSVEILYRTQCDIL